MPLSTKNDFSMRVEHTGSMVVTQGAEYICNIMQRLFYMIPGTDDYEKEMGLDIRTRAQRPYSDGARDVEYETEITKQFMTYTDIIPNAVIAVYRDRSLEISMEATYLGFGFTATMSSDPNSLGAQILPKAI